jgi:clan AA aspartic protease
MMVGKVDVLGRALLALTIHSPRRKSQTQVDVWIDTGFNGELVLPRKLIEEVNLPLSGTVKAILADGAEVALNTYICELDWFGETRQFEVVSNEGEFPLLGVGLLLGRDLKISYRMGELEIK